MSRWYVIQCKPREERRALENLERQRFYCYLPVLTMEKLRQRRRRAVHEPLFPGYLFIHLSEISDNWHPICSTRGVLRLVRFRQYPVPVSDEIIESIRQRLASDKSHEPYLQRGDRVRVTEGPFCDIEAIFVANDGRERVALLLNILQREQRVSFPIASVRKVAANVTL
jgi:transcriptional antiterminator RfaH